MTSYNFTNALKMLEQNRVDALKWIVECCNKDLDFNDVDLTVKPKRDNP